MFSTLQATEKATVETITSFRHWAPGLYSITTTRPDGYRFTAGQYARLGLSDAKGNLIWRAYSIVSAPADNHLEYYLVDVPGGAFTSLLGQCKPNDQILVEKQSYGFMTADRFADGDDLWMLATGTGLGPFISILRDEDVWQRFKQLILVHSARHAQEFAYQDELQQLAQRHAGSEARLHIVQTATRDTDMGDAPHRLHGRITTLLENGELEKHVGAPLQIETSRIMLCGNPQMIEDTRAILHQRGMRPCRRALPGQFVTENYW